MVSPTSPPAPDDSAANPQTSSEREPVAPERTGDRIASITREARMALSTIRGFTEMLEEELEADDAAVRDLGYIRRASERIETLVAELEDCATDAQQVAARDPLTGIANRRHLFEVGEHMVRSQQTLALVVLDVDEFKRINDQFGHHVGDAVLKMVVERFSFAIREGDLLARLAGDEFVAILPGADEDTALRVAQRLRHVLVDAPFVVRNRRVHVTCSIGVAVRGPDHLDLTELIDTADRRMYRAKRAGRDQIAC
jgi:diguanylate cyclase (GGDEF)-like protein